MQAAVLATPDTARVSVSASYRVRVGIGTGSGLTSVIVKAGEPFRAITGTTRFVWSHESAQMTMQLMSTWS